MINLRSAAQTSLHLDWEKPGRLPGKILPRNPTTIQARALPGLWTSPFRRSTGATITIPSSGTGSEPMVNIKPFRTEIPLDQTLPAALSCFPPDVR